MLSDGAGALCVEPTPIQGVTNLQINWIKTYSYANEIQTCMYSGADKLDSGDLLGWSQIDSSQWLDNNVFSLKQDVKLLNQHIVEYAIKKTLLKIMATTGLKANDIDYFLPHMSSMYFLPKIQQGLNEIDFHIPKNKWFTNLATKGNTGAAAMFIMIDELMQSDQLKKGEKILCFVPESGRFSSGFMLLTAV
jgi:3-oxoacyl-[acyl-carrier-protein] synthase-3